MNKWIKILFFALLVKPLVLIGLGLNIRGQAFLPKKGPAVIAANHNSHLDTLVLLSLFPLAQLARVRPVAAADYFLHGPRILRWFALVCIGIIPLERSGKSSLDENFKATRQALDQGDILILFPEGSRGSPEKMSRLKKGIHHLLKDLPQVPVIPVRLYGLGKALPKGEALFVPFNCDISIGKPVFCNSESLEFIQELGLRFEELNEFLANRNSTLD